MSALYWIDHLSQPAQQFNFLTLWIILGTVILLFTATAYWWVFPLFGGILLYYLYNQRPREPKAHYVCSSLPIKSIAPTKKVTLESYRIRGRPSRYSG